MPRPKSENKKNIGLYIRLTETERDKIISIAKENNLNTSEYVRLKALGKTKVYKPKEKS